MAPFSLSLPLHSSLALIYVQLYLDTLPRWALLIGWFNHCTLIEHLLVDLVFLHPDAHWNHLGDYQMYWGESICIFYRSWVNSVCKSLRIPALNIWDLSKIIQAFSLSSNLLNYQPKSDPNKQTKTKQKKMSCISPFFLPSIQICIESLLYDRNWSNRALP